MMLTVDILAALKWKLHVHGEVIVMLLIFQIMNRNEFKNRNLRILIFMKMIVLNEFPEFENFVEYTYSQHHYGCHLQKYSDENDFFHTSKVEKIIVINVTLVI